MPTGEVVLYLLEVSPVSSVIVNEYCTRSFAFDLHNNVTQRNSTNTAAKRHRISWPYRQKSLSEGSHDTCLAAQAIKVKTTPSSASLIFKNNKKIHKRTKHKKQNGPILNNHKHNNGSSGKIKTVINHWNIL